MATQVIVFVLLSIPIVFVSRKPLRDIHSHGFYRFLGWEGILWLVICNISYWFDNPFSTSQVFSWLLLIASVYYVMAGTFLLIRRGKPQRNREGSTLYGFEKTTQLVDTGIYKWVRHPLYGSLVLVTWGIFLKHMTLILLAVTVATTILFYLTAVFDEKECIAYFGDVYKQYMKRSKMFIPFLL